LIDLAIGQQKQHQAKLLLDARVQNVHATPCRHDAGKAGNVAIP